MVHTKTNIHITWKQWKKQVTEHVLKSAGATEVMDTAQASNTDDSIGESKIKVSWQEYKSMQWYFILNLFESLQILAGTLTLQFPSIPVIVNL